MFAQNNSAHIELISIEEITQYESLHRDFFLSQIRIFLSTATNLN